MAGAVTDLFGDEGNIRKTAPAAARQLFRWISLQLGHAEAQRIFRKTAAVSQPSKGMRQEIQKAGLLTHYIQRGGGPLGRHAKRLAKLNAELPGRFRFGSRGSTEETALRRQLARLLDDPVPKNASPLLRQLIKEARALPRAKRGRPRK